MSASSLDARGPALGLVLGERRVLGPSDDRAPLAGGGLQPLPLAQLALDRALEDRGDVAHQQLVRVHRGRPVGHLVAEAEEAAEATGLRLELAQVLDQVVGCPDHHQPALVELVHRALVVVDVRRERDRRRHPEVVEEVLEAIANVLACLLLGVCEVEEAHQPPARPVHGLAMLRCRLLDDPPGLLERLEPHGAAGRDRQQRDPVLAGEPRADRRSGGRRRDLEARIGEGPEVQLRVLEREPVRLHRDGLLALEQLHDRVQRLLRAPAVLGVVEPHRVGVEGQRSRSDPEDHASPRHVVEQRDALGDEERMVVGQRGHAGRELDVPRALRGGRDEDLRRTDQLPTAVVMLAEPRLVVTDAVEPLDELEAALERPGGVLRRALDRRCECSEAQRCSHASSVFRWGWGRVGIARPRRRRARSPLGRCPSPWLRGRTGSASRGRVPRRRRHRRAREDTWRWYARAGRCPVPRGPRRR